MFLLLEIVQSEDGKQYRLESSANTNPDMLTAEFGFEKSVNLEDVRSLIGQEVTIILTYGGKQQSFIGEDDPILLTQYRHVQTNFL